MQSFMPKRLGASLCAVAVAAVAALTAVAPAHAGTTHIYNGGLSAGRGYGSSDRHTMPNGYPSNYVEVNSDHTACGGMDPTFDGFAYRAPQYFTLSECGAGDLRHYFVSGSANHGVVFNPNGSTVDSISNSYYAWG